MCGSIHDIERVVRRGGWYIAEALFDYWPTVGDNEVLERNQSIHLARAFSERAFNVYTEAHTRGSVKIHLDFLALDPVHGIQVRSECKRLHNADQADLIRADVDRVVDFELLNSHLEYPCKYGLISATTWNQKIAEWWSSSNGAEPSASPFWDALGNHPALKDAVWGSVALCGYISRRSKNAPFHYFLYCIFPIPDEKEGD